MFIFGANKESVAKAVDIGDGIEIDKVGYDRNGNWSYWVRIDGARAKKIQHMSLVGTGAKGGIPRNKITKEDFKANFLDKDTVKAIKKYIKEFM